MAFSVLALCISVMEEAIPVLSSLYESLSLKISEILICPNWSQNRRARRKAGDVCFELHNTCILLELSVMPMECTGDDMYTHWVCLTPQVLICLIDNG